MNNNGQSDLRPVGKEIRALHLIIDTVGWIALTFLLVLIAPVFALIPLSLPDTYLMRTVLNWGIFLLGYLLYYSLFEAFSQATLGKLATKSRVVTSSGNVPSFSQILLRTVSRLIPFEWISFLFTKRGVHDMISRTYVVRKLN